VKEKLAFCFCAAYFLWFAAPGLTAPFLPDDLMNLYFAWFDPWRHERMAAQWILRALFALFGLNALAFHAVCFGLLLLNLWLAWRLFLRLGGFDAAAPALLLFTYNAYMIDLYLSSGTIYDLLCFAGTASALLLHVRWRQNNVTPGWILLGLWAVLFLLALGSKEMAVMLPVFLVLYEAIYHGRRWQGRTLAVSSVLTAAFLASRFLLPGAMAVSAAYRPTLGWSIFQENWSAYWGDLLYLGPAATPLRAWFLLAACLIFAFASRRRAALFGCSFFLAGALPVIFIARRGSYVLYLPYLGLCLLIGATLESAARRVPHRGIALMVLLAVALFSLHTWATPYAREWHPSVAWKAPLAIEGLQRELPTAKRGARLLFLEDPYDKEEWDLMLAARLLYRDETLFLERQKRVATPLRPEEIATYDVVFRMTREDGVRRISSATPPVPSPTGLAR
jgi:hypothetical protein